MQQRQRQQAALIVDRRRIVLRSAASAAARTSPGLVRKATSSTTQGKPQQRRQPGFHARPRRALDQPVDRDPAERPCRRRRHRQRRPARPQQFGQRIALAGVAGDRPRPRRCPARPHRATRAERQQPERPLAGADQRLDEIALPGFARISAGVAYCTSLPASITAILSPRWNASSMSWVTRTMVVPKRFWIASRSSCALVRMIGSSAPNGSSISSTLGSAASARATPTRCCWPPDSSCG